VRNPEETLTGLLEEAGVDFTASLPCEKIKGLLEMVGETFFHLPLTREEEGVGICAGAALAGRRPAIFVQSSGVGNMINALLSLTGFYELPLALFVSRRGVYQEKIEAQVPMGERLPGILKEAGISHSMINTGQDFRLVERRLVELYRKNEIHAFLLSPALWAESCYTRPQAAVQCPVAARPLKYAAEETTPVLTRYEVLEAVAPLLDAKAVVCNLGYPSKELFNIRHQPSNFYMLGSMGMATPIGLGISLASKKEVVVIDGDGSILMNPGTLATVAHAAPENLTILAIDNSAYGSTGSQPTLTSSCVDLELIAKGFGLRNTVKAATAEQLVAALKDRGRGPRFIHGLAVSGNRDVPNISLHHLENKKQVQDFLSS
jgi:sulfopyruvate decarboxylase beta subunit